MIDVMGGEHSLEFAMFRDLVIRGFRASHRVYPKVSTHDLFQRISIVPRRMF